MAKEWELTPHEFEERNPNEQAKMIASYLSQNYIEAYNSEIATEHAKKSSDKKSVNSISRNKMKPKDMRMAG